MQTVAFLLNALTGHFVTLEGFGHSGKRGWFDDLLVQLVKIEDVIEFMVFAFQCFVEQGSLHEVFAFFPIGRTEYPR